MKYFLFAEMVIIFVLALIVLEHQYTLERILDDQQVSLSVDMKVSKQTQSLQRRVDELQRELADLNRRHDLVTAATRMGWGDAYRLLRAGILTEQTQAGE